MAETPTTPLPEQASTTPAAPAAAPVSEQAVPVVAQVPVTETAAAPQEALKTETAPALALLSAEPVAEPAKPETKTDDPKTDAVKPEVKPEGEKPAEGEVKTETVEPVLPTYEPFKLPEGAKADEKIMGEFSGLLGQLELAKGDHAKTQEVGQKFVDLYQANLGNALKQQVDYFVQLHEQQKTKDVDALRSDPVIGGKGDDKVLAKNMSDIVNALNRHGGTKEEMTQFRQTLQERGVEGNLAIIRIVKNLTDKINRYENESSKMLPGQKPAPSKPPVGKGVLNSLYGGTRSA